MERCSSAGKIRIENSSKGYISLMTYVPFCVIEKREAVAFHLGHWEAQLS